MERPEAETPPFKLLYTLSTSYTVSPWRGDGAGGGFAPPSLGSSGEASHCTLDLGLTTIEVPIYTRPRSLSSESALVLEVPLTQQKTVTAIRHVAFEDLGAPLGLTPVGE